MIISDTNHIHCPVCKMTATRSKIEVTYQQLLFKFCSIQCKKRFQKHPQLYISTFGKSAAKSQGQKILKQRVITLNKPLNSYTATQLQQSLSELMGIKELEISTNKISISYDLLEISAEEIEQYIEGFGSHLGENLASKIKRAWIHYTEETELENLEETGGYSCHKPP